MINYLIRRFLQSILLLFIVSVVVFTIIHAAPGGPAVMLNPEVSAELAAEFEEQLGLDDPIPVQYIRWISNVAQLDMGISLEHSVPATTLVLDRIPATLLLSGAAIVLSTITALVLGTLSAIKRYSVFDYGATLGAFLGLSLPGFWLGIMMIILFSVKLGWLPASGMTGTDGGGFIDRVKHLIMPTIVLSSFVTAQLMRYVRSSMVEVLRNDFIRSARAKGLSERIVIMRHALKNALIPVVTVLGVITPRLLGGTTITETVFAWPGMGRLAVNAAFTRDFPVIMTVTMFIAVLVVFSNLLTDVCYSLLDPRIKYE